MIFPGLVRITITMLLSVLCMRSAAHASSPTNDQDKVVETVRQMVVALTNDDADLFKEHQA